MDIRKRLELSTEITPFQRRVYMELLNVPAGPTITYGELAQRIGCRSAQAVGQASAAIVTLSRPRYPATAW